MGALVILGILFFLWRRRRARRPLQQDTAVHSHRPDMPELEEGGKFELHGAGKSQPADATGSTTVTESFHHPVELPSDEASTGHGHGALGLLPVKLEGADYQDSHLSNNVSRRDGIPARDDISGRDDPGREQSPTLVAHPNSLQDQWSPTRSSYIVSEPRESLVSSASARMSGYTEDLSAAWPSPDPAAQRASLNEQLERLRERKRQILNLRELEREEAELERRLSQL